MSAKTPGPGGGPGFRLAGFPKEFERNFLDTFDKRYYSILLITFLVCYGFMFFMARQDWSLSQDQLDALKKRAIEKVYDVEFVLPEDDPDEVESGIGETAAEEQEEPEEVSDKGRERIEESVAQRTQRRRQTQADLEARSRQMQQEVASQGILAIATGAGGSGSGNLAYSDVLRGITDGAGGVQNIGDLVDGTAGISAASAPGERSRNARGSGARQDGSGTGIDDMISGTSVSGTSSFDRRGNIQLKSENVQLTSGAGSRDPETITAAINKQSKSVEYCYKSRAKVNPNLKGRIELEIGIASSGKVTTASILSSTLGDKRLEDCIVKNVKRWKFGPVDTADVRIRVPFIF